MALSLMAVAFNGALTSTLWPYPNNEQSAKAKLKNPLRKD